MSRTSDKNPLLKLQNASEKFRIKDHRVDDEKYHARDGFFCAHDGAREIHWFFVLLCIFSPIFAMSIFSPDLVILSTFWHFCLVVPPYLTEIASNSCQKHVLIEFHQGLRSGCIMKSVKLRSISNPRWRFLNWIRIGSCSWLPEVWPTVIAVVDFVLPCNNLQLF